MYSFRSVQDDYKILNTVDYKILNTVSCAVQWMLIYIIKTI